MKVPFVTVNTGHIKIISAEDDIAYPYALAVVQDSYPDGGALPPYWRVEYQRYQGLVRFDLYYAQAGEPELPASANVVVARDAAKVYRQLTGKDNAQLGDGAALITALRPELEERRKQSKCLQTWKGLSGCSIAQRFQEG